MSTLPPLAGRLAALALLCAAPASAAPLITEFLTNNNTGILDEDVTRQDWIEVHNPDAAAVDLGGYHLTDDVAQPMRWTFPAGVIVNPGAYLVVFASGKDRTVVGQNLHTNFSLASGGEYLALNAPGGTPVLTEFAPTYPAQAADVSYGLINPVAGSPVGFFTVPTPGVANNVANAPADPVQFSPASKTFNQGASFTVTLSTPSPGDTIRYTTNRGRPLAVQGIMGTFTTNLTTDELTLAAHGFSDRDEVQINTTNIAGLGQTINYYVILVGPNTIKLSAEPGGTPFDLTATTSVTLRRDAATFTATAPALPATSVCTSAYHRFYDRDPVQVTTTGALPGGLVAGTTYYVRITPATPVDRNNYGLAATPGGTLLTFTNTGAGVHTMRLQPSAIYSTPLTVNYSQRIRARAFESGRPDGPIGSESYLALDPAAQTFTSNIPVMILHSWGSNHPSGTAPTGTTPEDTKEASWFLFEPKLEGANMVTRLTNTPDLVTPAYFERRGSSTFGATKYSMTMGAHNESGTGRNVSPLGFASNDDFVLNAPFDFDRSLMHNDLIYRLSNEIGRYAAHTQHVEMFMSVNNDQAAAGGNPAWGFVTGAATSADYYGVYSLQDKISRGNQRLDIERLEPTDNTAPNVQGGYVWKIDRRDLGDVGFAGAGRTAGAGGVGPAWVQPKEFTSYPSHLPVVTAAQSNYMTTTLNNMYAAIQAPTFMSPTTGYQAHFDVPACIDHWWLSVLPKSADAFRLSGYWHKSRYGKIVMGPIFDFDRAMGSTDARDWIPTTWRGDVSDYGTDYFHSAGIFTPNYFQWMFQDPNFWQAIIDRYEELRRGALSTAHVHALVDEYTELLDPGNSFVNTALSTPARRNQLKFGGPRAAGQFPGLNGHFRGEAQWLKNWWGKAGAVTANGRLDFIDGQFMRPPTGNFPAGPLPAGSNLTLSSPSQSISGVKIYYTTDGTDPRAPATDPLTLYTPGAAATIATLLPDISPVRAIVPTSDIGTAWRGVDTGGNGNNADDFDDSAWFANAAGTINGVGYDNDIAVSYLPSIGIRWSTGTGTGTGALVVPPNNATNTMFGTNGSCFLRLAFTLSAADLALINTSGNRLMLGMRFDDAFVAYVNGTLVTNSTNVTVGAANVLWNSVNTGGSLEAVLPPLAPAEFEITASAALFHTGTNLLAIQGLNGTSTTSSDFLMQPRLYIVGPPGARPAYTPSLTAGAVEFTAPLPINAPTQIIARTLHPQLASDPPTATTSPAPTNGGPVPNGSSWSGPTVLYYFPGAVSASQASIQITEVCYQPSPPAPDEVTNGWTNSNDFEFIRLTNTGAVPVDLTGIYFSNGLEFTAVPGLQNWLAAGASVIVVENLAAFTYRYGSTFTILGEFQGELDDGGEHIVLNDKTGAVISDFIYGDDAPWPTLPDTAGHSLLYVAGDQNLPGSWIASHDPGGTSANTYARWLRRYYENSDHPFQGMTVNDDGDPLNNLGEYAFATDPRTPGSREASAGVAVAAVPPRLTVIRRAGTTDLTWSFEVSSDLTPGAWTPTGAAPVSVINLGDGTESVTWEAPVIPGATRLYLQVRVTSP